MSENYNN